MIKFVFAAAFIALNFYVYNELGSGAAIPERRSFSEFPMQIGDWQCQERGEMDGEVLESLGALSNTGGTLVISDVERHGLRPFLTRIGALAGHVNYRTKQPREEWTHAAVKGGWTLFDQANYVPWRFRAMAKFWSGAPGRYTLCDKYFLYFSRTCTHPS